MENLRDVVRQNWAIFKGFTTIKGIVHRIKLKEDAEPICCPQRRRSPKEEEPERACLRRWLEMGVMEPEVSPWAANNMFLPEKDTGTCVSREFRALNSLTEADTYPLEKICETIDCRRDE